MERRNTAKVLKLAAYQWITIGDSRLIVASNADFWSKAVSFTRQLDFDRPTGFVVCHYDFIDRPDQKLHETQSSYVENQALKERQRLLKEKHEIEKHFARIKTGNHWLANDLDRP